MFVLVFPLVFSLPKKSRILHFVVFFAQQPFGSTFVSKRLSVGKFETVEVTTEKIRAVTRPVVRDDGSFVFGCIEPARQAGKVVGVYFTCWMIDFSCFHV
jgi:hypothetical protein